jgi:hypothetical protein
MFERWNFKIESVITMVFLEYIDVVYGGNFEK